MAETLTVNDTPQQEGLTAEEQDSLQVGEQLADCLLYTSDAADE